MYPEWQHSPSLRDPCWQRRPALGPCQHLQAGGKHQQPGFLLASSLSDQLGWVCLDLRPTHREIYRCEYGGVSEVFVFCKKHYCTGLITRLIPHDIFNFTLEFQCINIPNTPFMSGYSTYIIMSLHNGSAGWLLQSVSKHNHLQLRKFFCEKQLQWSTRLITHDIST